MYYRLNIIEFRLPPLREHREDIPYLTAAFVKEFAKKFDKTIAGVSPGAERLLQNAPWPGNVRELRNVLERGCMSSEGRILSERDILSALGGSQIASAGAWTSVARPTETGGAGALADLTRERVQQALQQAGGNRSATARLLGISRRALYRRLDNFGLR